MLAVPAEVAVQAEPPMKIFVRTLTTGKTFELNILATDTMSMVKMKLCDEAGLAVERQVLIFSGMQAKDESVITELKIVGGTQLFVLMRPIESSSNASPIAPQVLSPNRGVRGAGGLRNLGNTCYMNSVLQALSNTVVLRRYYTSDDFKNDLMSAADLWSPLPLASRLATAFAKDLKRIWTEAQSVVVPAELKRLISERNDVFQGAGQQDAHEFLTFFLDCLHDAGNKAPRPMECVKLVSTQEQLSLPDPDVADVVRSRRRERDDSKIYEIFQVELRTETKTGTEIGHERTSTTFSTEICLSVPIPRSEDGTSASKVDLDNCLAHYACGKTDEGQKVVIWSAPECLIIHLKRFTWDEATCRSQKIETLVDAPLELHLPLELDPQSTQYKLYAVVNHDGRDANSGHYTANGLVGEDVDRQWCRFNDAISTRILEKDAVTKAAYILFYERVTGVNGA